MKKQWFLGLAAAALNLYKYFLPLSFIFYVVTAVDMIRRQQYQISDFFLAFKGGAQTSGSFNWAVYLLLINFLLLILLTLALHYLGKSFKNFVAGQYFIAENARLIKRAAIYTLLFGLVILVQNIALLVCTAPLSAINKLLFGLMIVLTIPFQPVFLCGMLILFVGEAFGRAAEMKQENDLTI